MEPFLHTAEKALEVRLDVVGDHVFRDLTAELLGRLAVVGDDLLDPSIDLPGGVKEGADGHGSASYVKGAVVAVGRIEAEKAERGGTFAGAGVEDHQRHGHFAEELLLDHADAQVGVERLKVGDEEGGLVAAGELLQAGLDTVLEGVVGFEDGFLGFLELLEGFPVELSVLVGFQPVGAVLVAAE